MQVCHVRRPGPLMQVVDILRNDLNIEPTFEFGNCTVTGIRLLLQHLPATHIVKFDYLSPVVLKSLRSANIFDTIIRPQTIRITESSQSTVGTYTRSGKNNDLFHFAKTFSAILLNKDAPTKISPCNETSNAQSRKKSFPGQKLNFVKRYR